MERVFKLFPDAHDRNRAFEWRQQKEAANRQWTSTQQKVPSFVDQEGGRFAGNLLDGQRHGYGIFCDQNGNTFQGEWLNNMKQGFFIVV